VPLARRHHICSYAFLVLALLATSFAVWESTKVALGKSLLNSLQELRSQKAVIDTETMQRESAGANPANWSDPTFPDANLSLHFCDNARYRGYRLTHPGDTGGVLAWWTDHEKTEAAKSDPGKAEDQNLPELLVFKTPAERDLCDRDGILASRFGLLYAALQQYRVDWPSLVGSSFTAIGIPFRALFDLFQRAAPPGAAGGNDIEWVIAARLLVLGNYVLPVTFALLGAIAYVIVDYFRKVRASLLAPPDLALGWIRLVLGLVVGACIGLLYSSSSPTSAAAGAAPSVATLMNALTLSACGVAFLAGFGVEGVFSMLETVIRRVFPAEPRDQPPA